MASAEQQRDLQNVDGGSSTLNEVSSPAEIQKALERTSKAMELVQREIEDQKRRDKELDKKFANVEVDPEIVKYLADQLDLTEKKVRRALKLNENDVKKTTLELLKKW
eukprot:snap_masked-scaffold_6-processed-gene-13.20-mRNA-1 protein AED:1.00 eAED:1.00 QI:0/-1/0/0/-1/1/1/0/107